MVQIAVANPLFRDATFEVLGPRVDLRKTSANVSEFPIKTDALKDMTKSETVNENVSTPGKSFFLNVGNASLGTVSIGSDTLFELKNGIELLDTGEPPPPVNPADPHAHNHPFIDRIGTEQEDTGQTPVKIGLATDAKTLRLAASLGVPTAVTPDFSRSTGTQLDLFV